MTSGYILIVAILVLGGVLATLGDRIGTRVGKARLSLFKMRPRNTATFVTIITGSLISASTLGILLATSGSLRDGIFKLDRIKKQLRIARAEVQTTNAQKNQVESELAKTRAKQADAQERLDTTNQNFQQAQAQLKEVSQQASILRSEIESLLAERQELFQQRDQLNNQIAQLKLQVTQLKEIVSQRDQEVAIRNQMLDERNRELAQQEQELAEQKRELALQDEELAEREARFKQVEKQLKAAVAQIEQRKAIEAQLKEAIALRETHLQELEQLLAQREVQLSARGKQLEERERQLTYLEERLAYLEKNIGLLVQSYRTLRQGNVAILRHQVLASEVVRVPDSSAATQAVERLLQEANQNAIQIARAPKNAELVQMTSSQVEQLVSQIKDGQDYVVRILSANNYVEGEKQVQVFADALPNQIVFEPGDVLAAVSIDSSTMTNVQIRQRLDQLLAASEFRARRAPVVNDRIQVGDGRLLTLYRFIEQLEQFDQPLEVRAVAQDVTYTAGPLKMHLVAVFNGQIIFST